MSNGRLNLDVAMQGASPVGEASWLRELFNDKAVPVPAETLVFEADRIVIDPAPAPPAAATGAMREKLDAVPYDLVPYQEITDAYTRVAEFGVKKYAAWNWSLGLKRAQLLSSLLRHAFAYIRGEDRDRESGLLHTDHILWNAAALSHNVHWDLEDGRRAEPPRAYKELPSK